MLRLVVVFYGGNRSTFFLAEATHLTKHHSNDFILLPNATSRKGHHVMETSKSTPTRSQPARIKGPPTLFWKVL